MIEHNCIITASGPSLNNVDISALCATNTPIIGVNGSPQIVKPNYWICVDPPKRFPGDFWTDPAVEKYLRVSLLSAWLANGKRVDTMPNIRGYYYNDRFRPTDWLSEETVNWGAAAKYQRATGFPKCRSVMFAALKLAWQLGFRTVYLFGCDFKMEREKAYAYEKHVNDRHVAMNMRCYRKIDRMCKELRPHFDTAGFRVLNCTPDSGLTAFEMMDAGEVFSSR